MSSDTPITALWTSHHSLSSGSLLTLDEPGKAKPGAPVSVFELSQRAGLQEVVLVEDRIGGFLAAYKTAEKLGVKLCYGVKLVVCSDHLVKDAASESTESKVIVFIKDTQGYHDLIRIWNRAWTIGHHTSRDGAYGRTDWASLSELWTPHLMMALPFFSSFIAQNCLTFRRIVPSLPREVGVETPLVVFREVDSRLPFAPLIDSCITRYTESARRDGLFIEEVPSKTIYYAASKDFRSYVLRRAIANRSTFDAPEVDHLSSDRFSFDALLEAEAARKGQVAPVS